MAGAGAHSLAVLWIVHIFAGIHGDQVTLVDTRRFKSSKSKTPQMLWLTDKASFQAQTLSECATKCRERPQRDCFSFVYNDLENKCQLGSWTAADGNMVAEQCLHDPDPSKFKKQPLVNNVGKLFTSACCEGDFMVRTLSMKVAKCLFYSTQRRNFNEAKADCQNKNSRLITFKTVAEMEFVQELLSCIDEIWVGIEDNCDYPGIDCGVVGARKLFWVDNSEVTGNVKDVVFKKLDNKVREGCIHLGGKFKDTFNDGQCSSSFYYVCEKDLQDETYC
ncbi:hypothetical protein EGW08_003274 [Elysia chlorotica]|uniref:C-type lectin domain-containing protein n=1 Tax=Elysia chlorotica TaxID=188477 RepID=A0A3S1CCH7_ELYCH|nr:hypothetical protein EGW08_003274 [Elysia chlorotica]